MFFGLVFSLFCVLLQLLLIPLITQKHRPVAESLRCKSFCFPFMMPEHPPAGRTVDLSFCCDPLHLQTIRSGCINRSNSAWRHFKVEHKPSLIVLPFHLSRDPLSRINLVKRPECKWWKSFLSVDPLCVDAGISGISRSLNMEAAGLKLQLFSAQASCLLPSHPLTTTATLWFCQSKCTSLAAKSSGHRPSGCSREMPIVLASTGPSQTAHEGTDGTNGRAESNRGTGTEPHQSAVQIAVVWMYCMANAPLCSSGAGATAMRHEEFKMIK